MIERLEKMEKRFNTLEEELTKEETLKDHEKLKKLSQEQSKMSEVIEVFQMYKKY